MNNDFALIAQLHKCVGETQTSLTNTLKKQIQEIIKTAQTAQTPQTAQTAQTAQTPQTPQTAKPYYFKVGEKKTRKLASLRKTLKKNRKHKNLTRKLKYLYSK